MKKIKLKENEVLVWKRCTIGNESLNGFIYPKSGIVEAPDWNDQHNCGGGLHGWTLGFELYFNFSLRGNFIVILVNKKDGYVELDNKVKFRKGKVLINTASIEEAHKLILSYYPNALLHWSTQTAGNNSTQRAGYNATQTAGYFATQTADSFATQTAGYNATQTAGNSSTQTAGSFATQVAKDNATQTAGYNATQTAGYNATQTAGNSSTQTAGYFATQTAGNNSTQRAGNNSTQRAGYNATQRAGNNSTQRAGYNSTHIVYGANCIVRTTTESTVILQDAKKKIINGIKDTTFFIINQKVRKKYKFTEDRIGQLEAWEVFVFGSNENGSHAGGAAALAKEKFGAIEGEGEGLKGQSYAFPTLDRDMQKRTTEQIKESIDNLIDCAHNHTNKIFLLTKVGCGIAGFTEQKMRDIFNGYILPGNIVFPENWN